MTSEQISSLYDQFNNYILQHFVFFWAIIVGILAIVGIALFFIAKSIINTRVETGLKDATEQIRELEKNSILMERRANQLEMRLEKLKIEAQMKIYDLLLDTGTHPIPGLKSWFSKDPNGLVFVSISVRSKDGEFCSGTNVSMLPVGFRPLEDIIFKLESGLEVHIRADGLIFCNPLQPHVDSLRCRFEFVAHT